jgi:glucan phosphoethanolaminetransferase (alkaline phosphatase superfamily)
MNSLIGSVDSQIVLLIAAIAILLLLITLLLRILKASAGFIVAIVAIVLVTQYFFGISPNQLWGEIRNLPQDGIQLVNHFDLNALTSLFAD